MKQKKIGSQITHLHITKPIVFLRLDKREYKFLIVYVSPQYQIKKGGIYLGTPVFQFFPVCLDDGSLNIKKTAFTKEYFY